MIGVGMTLSTCRRVQVRVLHSSFHEFCLLQCHSLLCLYFYSYFENLLLLPNHGGYLIGVRAYYFTPNAIASTVAQGELYIVALNQMRGSARNKDLQYRRLYDTSSGISSLRRPCALAYSWPYCPLRRLMPTSPLMHWHSVIRRACLQLVF